MGICYNLFARIVIVTYAKKGICDINVIKLSDNDKEGINKKIGSFFLSIFSYVLLTPNQKCAANYSFLLNE